MSRRARAIPTLSRVPCGTELLSAGNGNLSIDGIIWSTYPLNCVIRDDNKRERTDMLVKMLWMIHLRSLTMIYEIFKSRENDELRNTCHDMSRASNAADG